LRDAIAVLIIVTGGWHKEKPAPSAFHSKAVGRGYL